MMLTSQSQGFVTYHIHGSLIILPMPLKNPQKVWAWESQKHLSLLQPPSPRQVPSESAFDVPRAHEMHLGSILLLTWNFLLATKYCILLMTFTAVLCASVSLPRNTNTDRHQLGGQEGGKMSQWKMLTPSTEMYNCVLSLQCKTAV